MRRQHRGALHRVRLDCLLLRVPLLLDRGIVSYRDSDGRRARDEGGDELIGAPVIQVVGEERESGWRGQADWEHGNRDCATDRNRLGVGWWQLGEAGAVHSKDGAVDGVEGDTPLRGYGRVRIRADEGAVEGKDVGRHIR